MSRGIYVSFTDDFSDILNPEGGTIAGIVTYAIPAFGADAHKLFYWDEDDSQWHIAISGGGGGGAPDDANYLVGTSNATLTDEIVVGTTPGGELGGTWPSPTIDTVHSGSSHAGVQAAAEATAAAALATHEADTTNVHGITNTASLALATGTLAQFAATTSAQLAGVISDETGSGALVFGTSPTLGAPAIANFSSAQHDHTNAAGGGQLNATNVFSAGTVPTARLGSGSASSSTFLRGDQTWATPAGSGDVVGPASATDGVPALFDGITGKLIKNSTPTGTGNPVMQTSPTLTTPNIGTPSAGVLTNATGLPLTTGVTGTLPIANGGTGQTTQTAAFNALDPLTTKGDLIVRDNSDSIRLPVGTDGHVLTADSAQASGVKWAAGGGGSAGDIVATLVSAENAITTTASAVISKMNVISGTSANYTVTLPAASGNTGKLLGLRITPGSTKLFTIDGNGSETIDGDLTRVMWAGESAILLCDGSNWFKIAGKTRAMSVMLRRNADQTGVATTTVTTVDLNAADLDNTGLMADLANDRILIPRAGNYQVSGVVIWSDLSANSSRTITLFTEGSGVIDFLNSEGFGAQDGFPGFFGVTVRAFTTSENIKLRAFHATGSNESIYGVAAATGGSTFLAAVELPTW